MEVLFASILPCNYFLDQQKLWTTKEVTDFFSAAFLGFSSRKPQLRAEVKHPFANSFFCAETSMVVEVRSDSRMSCEECTRKFLSANKFPTDLDVTNHVFVSKVGWVPGLALVPLLSDRRLLICRKSSESRVPSAVVQEPG